MYCSFTYIMFCIFKSIVPLTTTKKICHTNARFFLMIPIYTNQLISSVWQISKFLERAKDVFNSRYDLWRLYSNNWPLKLISRNVKFENHTSKFLFFVSKMEQPKANPMLILMILHFKEFQWWHALCDASWYNSNCDLR